LFRFFSLHLAFAEISTLKRPHPAMASGDAHPARETAAAEHTAQLGVLAIGDPSQSGGQHPTPAMGSGCCDDEVAMKAQQQQPQSEWECSLCGSHGILIGIIPEAMTCQACVSYGQYVSRLRSMKRSHPAMTSSDSHPAPQSSPDKEVAMTATAPVKGAARKATKAKAAAPSKGLTVKAKRAKATDPAKAAKKVPPPVSTSANLGSVAQHGNHWRAKVNWGRRAFQGPNRATHAEAQADLDRARQCPSLDDAAIMEHMLQSIYRARIEAMLASGSTKIRSHPVRTSSDSHPAPQSSPTKEVAMKATAPVKGAARKAVKEKAAKANAAAPVKGGAMKAAKAKSAALTKK
jgi:hypothetical protein